MYVFRMGHAEGIDIFFSNFHASLDSESEIRAAPLLSSLAISVFAIAAAAVDACCYPPSVSARTVFRSQLAYFQAHLSPNRQRWENNHARQFDLKGQKAAILAMEC